MLRTRRVILRGCLLTALLLVACERPSASEPPTGYRGGVLLGTQLIIDGRPSDDRLVFTLDGVLHTAKVATTAKLERRSCAGLPEELPCPVKQEARVRIRVSALLDLRRRLPIGGSAVQGLVISGKQVQKRTFDLALPTLAPGRHCVLIAMIEQAQEVVSGQLPSHTLVSPWQLRVGRSNKDHCQGEPEKTVTSAPVGDCSTTVLSVSSDGLEVRRSIPVGQSLHAALPSCGGRTSGLLVKNGALGTGPTRIPAVGPSNRPRLFVADVGLLGEGEWHLVALMRHTKETAEQAGPYTAAVSEPVLIEAR